ncbi:MAG: type III pantothenate kinase [Thiolinea sp.]
MMVATSSGILLVDAGNTRLKWLWVNEGDFHEQSQQAETYAVGESPQDGALRVLEALLNQYQPEKVTLVHVLGAEFSHVLGIVCRRLGCELQLVKAGHEVAGIRSAYANPAHFGADRLVALIAARFFAQNSPAIIIDCGTAVTVDAVLPDGQHLGGLILPGLQLLSDALIQRTQAKHMSDPVFEAPVVFADNTAQGMGSGCLFSLTGAIEGICQRMCDEMSDNPQSVMKIICGGDAARVHKHLTGDFRLEPAALMTGLCVIAGHY